MVRIGKKMKRLRKEDVSKVEDQKSRRTDDVVQDYVAHASAQGIAEDFGHLRCNFRRHLEGTGKKRDNL